MSGNAGSAWASSDIRVSCHLNIHRGQPKGSNHNVCGIFCRGALKKGQTLQFAQTAVGGATALPRKSEK